MRSIHYHVFNGRILEKSSTSGLYYAVPKEEQARSFVEPAFPGGLDDLAESLAMQAILRRGVLTEKQRIGEYTPVRYLLTVSFDLPYRIGVELEPSGLCIAAYELPADAQERFMIKFQREYQRMKEDPAYSLASIRKMEEELCNLQSLESAFHRKGRVVSIKDRREE